MDSPPHRDVELLTVSDAELVVDAAEVILPQAHIGGYRVLLGF